MLVNQFQQPIDIAAGQLVATDLAAARIDQADHPAAHAQFNSNVKRGTLLRGDGRDDGLRLHSQYPSEASNTRRISGPPKCPPPHRISVAALPAKPAQAAPVIAACCGKAATEDRPTEERRNLRLYFRKLIAGEG
jgi:hypothetical protein